MVSNSVFKNPLALFSTSPITGYMRNGYCEVPPSDFGNHSVAGVPPSDDHAVSEADPSITVATETDAFCHG